MVNLTINGIPTQQEKGTTLLEAARFLGLPIPTLCDMEGLLPGGNCRLCVVEVGEGPGAKMVSSCTYNVEEGIKVHTSTARVIRARKMVLELLLGTAPQSKTIQDLAAAHDVQQQRFRQEHQDCILCGRCVRICEEQMVSGAIGFRGRGELRSIGTPFDMKSDVCRTCGACMYACPVCELRCTYTDPTKAVCGGCLNLAASCVETRGYDEMMCYMEPCAACEISGAVSLKKEKGR